MAKSPDAFRTISEVADELALPQHVLRFWETRFPQIRPMKRGGGRRYYRPDDIDLLRGIRYLLYGEGYTIRGVQRILREQGPRFVVGAGRGDMSDLYPPRPEDNAPEEEAAAEDEVLLDPAEMDEEPLELEAADAGQIETAEAGEAPTFDPRDFRPEPSGSIYAPPRPPSLGRDDMRRLERTLSRLLELKRLLDSARG